MVCLPERHEKTLVKVEWPKNVMVFRDGQLERG